jgi:peptidoglycan/LPS O-acetylase OafA/YrhL
MGVSLIARIGSNAGLSGLPAILIASALMLILAWVLHVFVEKPSQTMLLKVFRRRGYVMGGVTGGVQATDRPNS